MIDLTKDTWEEVINSYDRILVDFWATWCEPCKAMAPILQKIHEETIPVFKVDVDDEMELAKAQHIQSMPTIVYFENGKEVDRLIGAASKAKVLEHFNL